MRIFVIGASAGGRKAIEMVLAQIPANINAVFMIVVHGFSETPSVFVKFLYKRTNLTVLEAKNNTPLESGNVYIAKPDYHLFVYNEKIYISKGQRENLFRPSIDVLFRSAAVAYGNLCVGLLLTGRLNDGTAGLEAIKKCGGIAIIQNPATAEFAEMPSYASNYVEIDYVVNIEDIGGVLQKICDENIPGRIELPPSVVRENFMAIKMGEKDFRNNALQRQGPFSCSTCGGPLWKVGDSEIGRYRCHLGHAFTEEALLKSQDFVLEEALWIAVRTLEEKKMLLERVHCEYNKNDIGVLANFHKNKIDEVQWQISKLRNILEISDR